MITIDEDIKSKPMHPPMRFAVTHRGLTLDYRTKDVSPFYKDGAYYNSIEHWAWVRRFYMGECVEWLTHSEHAEMLHKAYLDRVSRNQPSQPDQSGYLQ